MDRCLRDDNKSVKVKSINVCSSSWGGTNCHFRSQNTDTDSEAEQVQSYNIYLAQPKTRLSDIETGRGQNHNICPNTGYQAQQ